MSLDKVSNKTATASVSAAEPDRHMIVRSFSATILSDARLET